MAKRALRGGKPELIPGIVDWCREYFEKRKIDDYIKGRGGWVSYLGLCLEGPDLASAAIKLVGRHPYRKGSF